MTVTGAETDQQTDRATIRVDHPPAIGPGDDLADAAADPTYEMDGSDGAAVEVADGFAGPDGFEEPGGGIADLDDQDQDQDEDQDEPGEAILVEDWLDQAAVMHEELSRDPEVAGGIAGFDGTGDGAVPPGGDGDGPDAAELPADPTPSSIDDPVGWDHRAESVDLVVEEPLAGEPEPDLAEGELEPVVAIEEAIDPDIADGPPEQAPEDELVEAELAPDPDEVDEAAFGFEPVSELGPEDELVEAELDLEPDEVDEAAFGLEPVSELEPVEVAEPEFDLEWDEVAEPVSELEGDEVAEPVSELEGFEQEPVAVGLPAFGSEPVSELEPVEVAEPESDLEWDEGDEPVSELEPDEVEGPAFEPVDVEDSGSELEPESGLVNPEFEPVDVEEPESELVNPEFELVEVEEPVEPVVEGPVAAVATVASVVTAVPAPTRPEPQPEPVVARAASPVVDRRRSTAEPDTEPATSVDGPDTEPDTTGADPAAARAERRSRRRFLLTALFFFVLLTANGAAAGYVISLYVPERWTAEAEVVFDTGTDQIDSHLDTRKVLLESSLVLDRALVDLPIDRDELEDDLEVFPIEASSALGINYADEDPKLAVAVVSAVVGTFTDEVESEAIDVSRPIYEARIEELTERRATLEQELVRLETANAEAEALEQAPPYPAEVRRMALESEQLLSRIEALEQTVLSTEISAAERADVQVVTEPRLLSEPSWPKPLAFTALGLLVGSVVAAVVLFLVASRRAA